MSFSKERTEVQQEEEERACAHTWACLTAAHIDLGEDVEHDGASWKLVTVYRDGRLSLVRVATPSGKDLRKAAPASAVFVRGTCLDAFNGVRP